jgi:hypothetical protein
MLAGDSGTSSGNTLRKSVMLRILEHLIVVMRLKTLGRVLGKNETYSASISI